MYILAFQVSILFSCSISSSSPSLSQRVILQRIIPALKEEFRNNRMIPFVLPIILLIAEDCTMQEYSDIIMPVLIPALRVQDPIQVIITCNVVVCRACNYMFQFSRLGIQVSLVILCLFVWAMVGWVTSPFFSFCFLKASRVSYRIFCLGGGGGGRKVHPLAQGAG